MMRHLSFFCLFLFLSLVSSDCSTGGWYENLKIARPLGVCLWESYMGFTRTSETYYCVNDNYNNPQNGLLATDLWEGKSDCQNPYGQISEKKSSCVNATQRTTDDSCILTFVLTNYYDNKCTELETQKLVSAVPNGCFNKALLYAMNCTSRSITQFKCGGGIERDIKAGECFRDKENGTFASISQIKCPLTH